VHLAHAATAYLSSGISDAVIVICDRADPRISVWRGRNGALAPIECPWSGPSFADVYARCAELLGFTGEARGQRLEALARLCATSSDSLGVEELWKVHPDHLECSSGWEAAVSACFARLGGVPGVAAAPLAAAVQRSITRVLLEWLAGVRRFASSPAVCLGGSLFYHSSINSAVKLSGLYADVFVPVDPGVPGLAVGAALHGQGMPAAPVSSFLGPSFSDAEIKATLDNCKLVYAWESDESVIGMGVDALMQGRLVGWLDGPMEWGPRALGARSILANPFAPFVLENLNQFLKRREPWRGYALSGEGTTIAQHFTGPAASRFMECDYQARDPEAFRHVLPQRGAALRIQTVDETTPSRFRRLLQAFGQASGSPILVNTSFNGFNEPMVCNPRDAVRVFYGSGVDLLVLPPFVLRK